MAPNRRGKGAGKKYGRMLNKPATETKHLTGKTRTDDKLSLEEIRIRYMQDDNTRGGGGGL